jgi:hypothetical protein
VLEGKQETIEALFRRIQTDQRHTDVIKLVDCPIEARLLAGWSMGCTSITDHQLALIKTIVDLEKVNWPLAKPSTNRIVNLLRSAYQSDFHDRQRVANPVVPTLLHDHVQEWQQEYRYRPGYSAYSARPSSAVAALRGYSVSPVPPPLIPPG